jgi:hypothetical protein
VEPQSLRACFPCKGTDLASARACEQAVFGRRFGNSAEELAHEYGPYEGSTSFGAIFTADGTALGAVRLIRPGARRVKTLQDASRTPWNVPEDGLEDTVGLDETRTWDVASFAVDSVAAGADRRIASALLKVMFTGLRDNAATSFVAVLDTRARRALCGLGVTMVDLPGAKPAPYLGSPSSVPVYRHLADLRGEHAEHFLQTRELVSTAGLSTVSIRR